jgi:RecA-family ATPase
MSQRHASSWSIIAAMFFTCAVAMLSASRCKGDALLSSRFELVGRRQKQTRPLGVGRVCGVQEVHMQSTKRKTQQERPWFLELVPFSTISPKPINWLWENMIPRGVVTVIEGWPGVGKSQVAIDIMARLSEGDCMPFTGKPSKTAASILVAPEDPVDSVVWPRLKAAVANLGNIHYLKGLTRGNGADDKQRFLLTANNLELLKQSIQDSHVELVYIDAVMGLLNGADANSDTEVRGVLDPLAEFADKTGISVLIGRHWSKGAGNRASHEKGIGSIAWSALSRSVLQVGYNPDDKDVRLLCLGKKNLAPDQGALSFRLEQVPVEIEGKAHTYTRIEWLEMMKDFDVQRLGTVSEENKELSSTKAEVWLTERLKEVSEIQSGQLKDEAKQKGHGKSAIETALKAMKESGHIRYEKRLANWWTIYTNYQPGDF